MKVVLILGNFWPSRRERIATLTNLHHDFGELCGVVAPVAKKAGGVFKRNDDTDSIVDGETLGFKHADDLAEVIRQCVAAAEDVEFLLHEEARFVGDRLLCIADVDHTTREGDLFDSSTEGVEEDQWLQS